MGGVRVADGSRVVCGEVAIVNAPVGFALAHVADGGPKTEFAPNKARSISRFDDAGNYRPLKTAPNLRRGWVIEVPDWSAAEEVLEQIYPGRLAVLAAFRAEKLTPTNLRQTLARQTGRYRVTAKITDAQINETVARVCRSDGGCLRQILWRRDEGGKVPSSLLPAEKFAIAAETGDALPLICQEACAILIGACRDAVKASD